MNFTRSALRRMWRGWKNRREADFRPVFICGIAGSGNTLMAALLYEKFAVAGFADESALFAFGSSPMKIASSATFSGLAEYTTAMEIPPNTDPALVRAACLQQYRMERDDGIDSPVMIDKAPNTHLMRVQYLARAFPNGKFIFVYREPVSHVAGLRRKWSLYRQASLNDLCDFWRRIQQRFLDDTLGIRDRVAILSYETLITDTEGTRSRLGAWAELTERNESRALKDRANKPGMALRNVVGGQIKISKDSNTENFTHLDPEQQRYVEAELGPFYASLRHEFETSNGS